jgi:hypothetical protein
VGDIRLFCSWCRYDIRRIHNKIQQQHIQITSLWFKKLLNLLVSSTCGSFFHFCAVKFIKNLMWIYLHAPFLLLPVDLDLGFLSALNLSPLFRRCLAPCSAVPTIMFFNRIDYVWCVFFAWCGSVLPSIGPGNTRPTTIIKKERWSNWFCQLSKKSSWLYVAHSPLWIHVRKSCPYEHLRRTKHLQIWRFPKSPMAPRRRQERRLPLNT